MKNKSFIFILLILFIATFGVTVFALNVGKQNDVQTETISVDPIASTITATGAIHSQNEATLHFQTAGQLTYLPFKEGDKVTQGQTIARLDTYALQRQMTQALNTYKSTRAGFDQTQQNAQDNQLQSQQVPLTNNAAMDKGNAINDAVKRIVDQNQANLDNSVITVELANYAMQLASLTAPFTGIITHEDVTVANQNVTPVTSFSIADPTMLVFRANVAATDIDFVSVGSVATMQLDGQNQTYQGTVIKIYPDKTTLDNGQQVYQVDVQSSVLNTVGAKSFLPFGQSGSVSMQSNAQENVIMVPSWTVLNHNYVWVMENNNPILKQVTVGKTHGQNVEITNGLLPGDKIIVNPKDIAKENYQLL